MGGRVSLPSVPPGHVLEAVRAASRRRFFLASAFVALGTVLLAVAQAFLLALAPVGGITGLILGALLQVLGIGSAAYAANLLSRMFPLSESGLSARFALLASLFVVLPVSGGVTAAYVLLALPEAPLSAPMVLVLVPALPFFWGPPSTVAALGLVYAARVLASERMAVVAGVGCGAVLGMAFSAAGGALVDPVGALQSARLLGDLFVVAVGFVLIAIAFRLDEWAVRGARAVAR